jgi:hypothetical protein
MLKITTRGFTFEEFLILAAMNIAVSNDRNPQMQTTSVADAGTEAGRVVGSGL